MKLRYLWDVVRDAGGAWVDDRAPRIGAALAFYTALSLSPMLVIVLAIVGMVYGEDAARGQLTQQIAGTVGEPGASAIEAVLANTHKQGGGVAALVVGIVILFVGASGVFGELQEAMNDVWKVRPKAGRPIWSYMRTRFLSFGMVLGIGFLLLVSLTLSTALQSVGQYASDMLPGMAGLLKVANFVLTFVIEAFLFGMIFKVLPDAHLTWRDVATGTLLTAALFTLGKFLISLYLGFGGVGSAFGAAGSVVAFLVWIYYSTQILLFGAEVTKIVADRAGRRIAPAEHAEPIPSATTPVANAPTSEPLPESDHAQAGGADSAACVGAAAGLGRENRRTTL